LPMKQTWTLKLDSFSKVLHLPMGPVTKVNSVKYIDTAGVQQTLASDQYVVSGDSIVEAYNVTWPYTLDRIDVVEVEYEAGYGEAATATPREIKLYVLAKLTEQFDPAVRPESGTVQSTFIDRLLDRYKVMVLR
jgi:uncharacterized phiE125 gp8 family phage protein